ncbi:serine/arginine-rich splicing factor SR45a-like isoform X1 [Salvia divinorum]
MKFVCLYVTWVKNVDYNIRIPFILQADSPRKRYARSQSPWEENSRSRSRSKSRSRSRSWSRPRERSRSRSRSRGRGTGREDVNDGTTLYVTGLSTRVNEKELEDHFSKEGKVKSVFLVVEPRSRVSRGFAFVNMVSSDDANRCIKHLNQSVLEGRYITVERSRRKRARTPTPGHYLGLKSSRGDGYGDRGRYRGGSSREDYGYRRSPRRSPYRGGRDYSPRHSPYGGRSRRERSRSYSPPRHSLERNYARGSR